MSYRNQDDANLARLEYLEEENKSLREENRNLKSEENENTIREPVNTNWYTGTIIHRTLSAESGRQKMLMWPWTLLLSIMIFTCLTDLFQSCGVESF